MPTLPTLGARRRSLSRVEGQGLIGSARRESNSCTDNLEPLWKAPYGTLLHTIRVLRSNDI